MRWLAFVVGVLLALIGLKPYLGSLGMPVVVDSLGRIPTFGAPSWVFLLVGIGVIIFAWKR